MKIISPSVSWAQALPDAVEVLERIERAGRTCYKSEERITGTSAKAFAQSIIDRGHESVLEHVSLSVRIVCDRGVSHEIVRHRIGMSYSQESTRYCNYGKADEIQVIEPPGLVRHEQKYWWEEAVKRAEVAYLSMVILGVSPQIARSVLPTCLKTEFVVTGNLRSWRHFLKLRLAPAAHPQMREVAGMVRDLFVTQVPVVFDEFREVSCPK